MPCTRKRLRARRALPGKKGRLRGARGRRTWRGELSPSSSSCLGFVSASMAGEVDSVVNTHGAPDPVTSDRPEAAGLVEPSRRAVPGVGLGPAAARPALGEGLEEAEHDL